MGGAVGEGRLPRLPAGAAAGHWPPGRLRSQRPRSGALGLRPALEVHHVPSGNPVNECLVHCESVMGGGAVQEVG